MFLFLSKNFDLKLKSENLKNLKSLIPIFTARVQTYSMAVNNRRMTVSVGYDTDGDNNLDSEEIAVTLTTYIANRWTS